MPRNNADSMLSTNIKHCECPLTASPFNLEQPWSHLVEGDEGSFVSAQVVSCCFYEKHKTIETVHEGQ